MKNLVQQLMLDRPDWLERLENDLHISVVRDGDLASLKYNQIESPMADPMVQQCRGMVVDVARKQVLAWPYNKFWNHGEHLADRLDWSTARVMEKLDGSLMILYFDRCGWRVASSGHPTAGGSFGADTRKFSDAFWQTWGAQDLQLDDLDEQVTYMFELCDSPNRVVVRHDKPRLVLHGARDLDDGNEATRGDLEIIQWGIGCELVNEFPIGTIDGCLAAAEALDPLKQEGFVVVDGAFNRVKIKSPRYVILHHLKGEATPRRAIELWQTGDTEELLNSFPEFRPVIEPVHAELDLIAAQCVKDFEENMPRASRKEFALAVKDRPWSAVLFRMLGEERHDVETAKAIMRGASLASLERLLAP